MVKCEDQKSFAFLKKEEKEKESELRMPLTAQGIISSSKVITVTLKV